MAESNIPNASSCNYVIKLKRVANSIIMQLCSDTPGFSFPRYKKTRWSGTKPCKCHVAVDFFPSFPENENDVPDVYLLKALVLAKLAETSSLHFSWLLMNCFSANRIRSDEFRPLKTTVSDPNNPEESLGPSAPTPLFHSFTNKTFALRSFKTPNVWCYLQLKNSGLWNNSCKAFRMYYTNRKHTVKASWETVDGGDNNLNDLIRHRQTGRFPWDWQNGCKINNITTIRRALGTTFSVPESNENMTSMWFGCNGFKS